MATIAQIFGMTFVGVILVCLVWTIMSYVLNSYTPNNKLKENIKKFDSRTK
jgi:Na+-transporting methylmalonyl-CoA/oxaloacetate decarboxylase gamma subunit|tara:strand:+ start:75 stop:227 length:153 start_codon:yes stop_codon:yes gene_type:complete